MNSLFNDDYGININKKKKTTAKKSSSKAKVCTNIIELNKSFTNLYGEEFAVKTKVESDPEKALKSDALSIVEKLALIKEKVLSVLGKQKDNILLIKDRETLHNYISDCIKTGRIDIDTETNNSLDPVTCKLMGPCFYAPGLKQAYVPINHRDPETKERLAWQLTEQDINEELQRVNDSKIDIIMHNGKFDYEVIKCTCNIKCIPTWDTMVASRLLNENEPAGLKALYRKYIDPNQAKYDIESLFTNVAYADVDPRIFAFYAATDALMTDKIYELQVEEFKKEEYGPHLDISGKHTVNGLRWLFHEVEMPIVVITAEMELLGVAVDQDFGSRLKLKYDKLLSKVDEKLNNIVLSLKEEIDAWKLTKEANEKTRVYVAKKSKMTKEKIEQQYKEIDEKGVRFKYGKAKTEQIDDPINMASPVQLAILLFDILNAPQAEKDSRAVGEEEVEAIKEKTDLMYISKVTKAPLSAITPKYPEVILNICNLILERRRLLKLISTYIDTIPTLVKHWPDGRIRFHLNPIGADTGRFSSGGKLAFMENDERIEVSGINIQNIPSHGDGAFCRMLFRGDIKSHTLETELDYFEIPETDEVETVNGWKKIQDIVIGDRLISEDNLETVSNIVKQDNLYKVYVA